MTQTAAARKPYCVRNAWIQDRENNQQHSPPTPSPSLPLQLVKSVEVGCTEMCKWRFRFNLTGNHTQLEFQSVSRLEATVSGVKSVQRHADAPQNAHTSSQTAMF